jgi:hypothetical protein
MLVVDEGEIRFHRGSTDDRFKLDDTGKPVCVREYGNLEWNITGPLTDEEFTKLARSITAGWTDSSDEYGGRRPVSLRTLRGRPNAGG